MLLLTETAPMKRRRSYEVLQDPESPFVRERWVLELREAERCVEDQTSLSRKQMRNLALREFASRREAESMQELESAWKRLCKADRIIYAELALLKLPAANNIAKTRIKV